MGIRWVSDVYACMYRQVGLGARFPKKIFRSETARRHSVTLAVALQRLLKAIRRLATPFRAPQGLGVQILE